MQTLVIRISERVARQARSFIESGDHGYNSLNEFVEVALTNQLNMESGWRETASESIVIASPHRLELVQPSSKGSEEKQNEALSLLLTRPTWNHPKLPDPVKSDERLFALTNRLSPVKVATRVLANMSKDGDWPKLKTFHEQSALAARQLGIRFREEDRRDRRSGAERRWVGYPIGPDESAALNRFVFSFTIVASGGSVSGPLAVLGLATVMGSDVLLTEAGWELAKAPSPLLGETTGGTVSDEEAKILRQQIRGAQGEAEAVRDFLSNVKRSAGNQDRLDELLAVRYPKWTQNLTIAHRAAMLGRLGDLKALSVSGRGTAARIQLLPAAQELEAV